MTKAVKRVNALMMLAAFHVLSSPLHAQGGPGGLGHTEDASTPPKGVLRLRPIIAWTRYDALFADTGVASLGRVFTSDSLGASTFAPLTPLQTDIGSLAQTTAYRLSLGTSRMQATAREERMPFAFDFGLTRRISFSVMVPVVRKRVATVFRLDSTGSNVGPNLNRTNAAATQLNALVQTEFAAAESQLQARLTSCQQDPSGAGCAAVLAQAPALLSESQQFASLVGTVYGSSTSDGAAFVPRASSAEQTAIALRIADFNARYSALGVNGIQTVPVGAGGPAGTDDFQSFVLNDIRGDSLNGQERVGIGDVELGLKARLIDRVATDQRPYGLQFAVAAGARLPTGSTERGSGVDHLALGAGEVVVTGSAVLDASVGRFGLTTAVSGSGPLAQSSADVLPFQEGIPRMPETQWVEVHARPRWHLSRALAVHGAYSYRRSDNSSGHLAGGGVTFMPLAARAGSSPPMEMRFTHLESVRGDAGMPKIFRDQLEVRAYLRLFR